MTEHERPQPIPSGRDPRKPGSEVRGSQVFAAFLVGGAATWALRILLFSLLSDAIRRSDTPAPGLFAALFPTAVLVTAILWAGRTGRKAWAIGMAIYAAVGGLLVGGTAAFIYVVCSGMKI